MTVHSEDRKRRQQNRLTEKSGLTLRPDVQRVEARPAFFLRRPPRAERACLCPPLWKWILKNSRVFDDAAGVDDHRPGSQARRVIDPSKHRKAEGSTLPQTGESVYRGEPPAEREALRSRGELSRGTITLPDDHSLRISRVALRHRESACQVHRPCCGLRFRLPRSAGRDGVAPGRQLRRHHRGSKSRDR